MDRVGHDSQRKELLTWRYWGAPRARLERGTYCLGGTTTPALCRPANTHVTSERNSHRQSLSERSWQQGATHSTGYREAARVPPSLSRVHGCLSSPAPMLGPDSNPMGVTSDSASRTF
jgi:hypothetical protein